LTPIALRGAFQLKSRQDIEEGLASPDPILGASSEPDASLPPDGGPSGIGSPPGGSSFRVGVSDGKGLLHFSGSKLSSDAQ